MSHSFIRWCMRVIKAYRLAWNRLVFSLSAPETSIFLPTSKKGIWGFSVKTSQVTRMWDSDEYIVGIAFDAARNISYWNSGHTIYRAKINETETETLLNITGVRKCKWRFTTCNSFGPWKPLRFCYYCRWVNLWVSIWLDCWQPIRCNWLRICPCLQLQCNISLCDSPGSCRTSQRNRPGSKWRVTKFCYVLIQSFSNLSNASSLF